MPSPLLSTFHAGENRVTSSTMAVFERVDLVLVQELLEKAAEAPGILTSIRFENQVTSSKSVPDARISARFSWWFETKTVRGAYASDGHGREQLLNHATELEADDEAILFVLTPDPTQPAWLGAIDGVAPAVSRRIVWISFRGLADAIDDMLSDTRRLLGEQTRFLLAELRAFYEASGLLANDDVVVVAARIAWANYLEYGAYICQPDRAFKDGLQYFGFYRQGRIEQLVPMILRWIPSMDLTRAASEALAASTDPLDAQLGSTLIRAIDSGARVEGERYGVMLLTSPEDERTIRLPITIENDARTSTGKPWAWTLGQRYTDSTRLKAGVKFTSELDAGASR